MIEDIAQANHLIVSANPLAVGAVQGDDFAMGLGTMNPIRASDRASSILFLEIVPSMKNPSHDKIVEKLDDSRSRF